MDDKFSSEIQDVYLPWSFCTKNMEDRDFNEIQELNIRRDPNILP